MIACFYFGFYATRDIFLCSLKMRAFPHWYSQVYKKLGENHLAQMNFSWAIDLDPKGANNQIKEAINKRYLPDDDDTTMGLDTADTMDQSVGVNELSDEDED